MILYTTWKSRPLSPEQANRMMGVWGKVEAGMAESPNSERLCWYMNVDGSGGMTVSKVNDYDAAAALGLAQSMALAEFIEMDSKIVLDLDAAMPAILKGMEFING